MLSIEVGLKMSIEKLLICKFTNIKDEGNHLSKLVETIEDEAIYTINTFLHQLSSQGKDYITVRAPL